jgi:DNA-directed RNA polymerase specialized sigma24 family protein
MISRFSGGTRVVIAAGGHGTHKAQDLMTLDEKSRTLCNLIGIQGYECDEVSLMIGLPLGSIGPMYMRAKNKLRIALEN